jgi:hypothetical protein
MRAMGGMGRPVGFGRRKPKETDTPPGPDAPDVVRIRCRAAEPPSGAGLALGSCNGPAPRLPPSTWLGGHGWPPKPLAAGQVPEGLARVPRLDFQRAGSNAPARDPKAAAAAAAGALRSALPDVKHATEPPLAKRQQFGRPRGGSTPERHGRHPSAGESREVQRGSRRGRRGRRRARLPGAAGGGGVGGRGWPQPPALIRACCPGQKAPVGGGWLGWWWGGGWLGWHQWAGAPSASAPRRAGFNNRWGVNPRATRSPATEPPQPQRHAPASPSPRARPTSAVRARARPRYLSIARTSRPRPAGQQQQQQQRAADNRGAGCSHWSGRLGTGSLASSSGTWAADIRRTTWTGTWSSRCRWAALLGGAPAGRQQACRGAHAARRPCRRRPGSTRTTPARTMSTTATARPSCGPLCSAPTTVRRPPAWRRHHAAAPPARAQPIPTGSPPGRAGLVSVASLMLGVGAGSEAHQAMVLSGVAGLVAGALSMAVGGAQRGARRPGGLHPGRPLPAPRPARRSASCVAAAPAPCTPTLVPRATRHAPHQHTCPSTCACRVHQRRLAARLRGGRHREGAADAGARARGAAVGGAALSAQGCSSSCRAAVLAPRGAAACSAPHEAAPGAWLAVPPVAVTAAGRHSTALPAAGGAAAATASNRQPPRAR